jgi:hypothetical protein
MNALIQKLRETFSSIGRRAPDPQLKPVRDLRLVTPALSLTPAEIMAAVQAERDNPKHRAEIEYYRAKSVQHLGGSS